MKHLSCLYFFKHYNSVLNETLVKNDLASIYYLTKQNHIITKEIQPNDILVGIVQTKPYKTEVSPTFKWFKFDISYVDFIFYRKTDSDNFFDSLYVFRTRKMIEHLKFIRNNQTTNSLSQFEYSQFLSQIVSKYQHPQNSEVEQKILKIITQTSKFLTAEKATQEMFNEMITFLQGKSKTSTSAFSKISQQGNLYLDVKTIHTDSKILSAKDFTQKYENIHNSQQQNHTHGKTK